MGEPKSSVASEVGTPAMASHRSAFTVVFWASFLGLFLELALIRWVSSEIRVFAYCKNLVLVACFLGFGAGCFLARRKIELLRSMFVLLLLVLVVRLPWQSLQEFGPRRVSDILAEFSGFMIFHQQVEGRWTELGQLLFAIGWTSVMFFAAAYIMVPFGQLTAAAISKFDSPVRAYSINVAGSLLGILTFSLMSSIGTPPLIWFVPIVLGCLIFVDSSAGADSPSTAAPRWQAQALIGLALAMTLVMLPDNRPSFRTFWSGYQKLSVFEGREPGVAWHIFVNNTGFQNLRPQPTLAESGDISIDRFSMPYAFRRPAGKVLIVGAGSGNDAAIALRAGATSVTAVEIDRKIYELGAELHPQAPYSDPRVEVVIDDARNYLKRSHELFDVIVFSHLDSHALLSSYTNVRLDNYIYTVEALREARSRLAPGGIVYISFFAQEAFVGHRLATNLEAAFGHPPVYLQSARRQGDREVLHNVYLLTGEAEVQEQLQAAAAGWSDFAAVPATHEVDPSTDAWPFLPLEKRSIPPFILLISIVILALSLIFVLAARPSGAAFDGRVFWLGAAFMLLEVHNVSRLALVFGTTWKVNAWVVGVILGLILLANATYLALSRRGRRPGRWAVGGLFATLAAAWLVPLETFIGADLVWGPAAATLLLSAPIYFAGLVFAEAFAESAAPGFALGWNILGAVTGGMLENLSYVAGIPALVPLAALLYLAAIAWPRSPVSAPIRQPA